MNVLMIEPGALPRQAEIQDNLSAMQQAVGGPIQAIYPFSEPVALICHEEGKLIGLPLNRALQDEEGEIYDIIAGPFFLCGAPPDSENFTSLTPNTTSKPMTPISTLPLLRSPLSMMMIPPVEGSLSLTVTKEGLQLNASISIWPRF